MEKYYKRKEPPSSNHIREKSLKKNVTNNMPQEPPLISTPKMPTLVDLDNLPWDPADRIRILDYHPNQREEIRRRYWLNGPCQPVNHNFPARMIGNSGRCFSKEWFNKYPRWLEYSVKSDKAFCLCCYLCSDYMGNQGGSDTFSTKGFNNWNKSECLTKHVGDINSYHNRALQSCDNLVKQKQSIDVAFHKQDDIVREANRIRLNATIDACRFCLKCALPFRGHDEKETSIFKGNFLETMDLILSQNEELRNLPKAAGNNQYKAPSIQKDIATCFELEILESIFKDIGDGVFSLLVDESSDVSKKEQMAIVLRYVDAHGIVKERFVGIVHVKETTSLFLKDSIVTLFSRHNLSLGRLRGQGYDGASNMRGEFNGLKARIMEENKSAYYIHCLAHQLQLVVVAVARKHLCVTKFFDKICTLMNVVCGSCKRKDNLLENEKERVRKCIRSGLIETGSGLNQELCFIRPGDTRWNSHYKTLLRLVDMFPSIIDILEYVKMEGANSSHQNQARGLLKYLKSFDCVFLLHLMLRILGLTNILSKALQRKNQDILEAVSLVISTKEKLQELRLSGFAPLFVEVSSFCGEHGIPLLDMKETCFNSRRQRDNITNRHHYEFDCFNTIMDMLNLEFGDRFSEGSTELLENMAALNPCDSFSKFDVTKLKRLSEFYPYDFDSIERRSLEHELDLYFHNVRKDERFSNLKGITDVARVMVETKKYLSYPLVYRLLRLALVLSVATAKVERCFSAMKLVKTDLRNRIGEEFLNACVICTVEKEALADVKNENVIERFQKMGKRTGQL